MKGVNGIKKLSNVLPRRTLHKMPIFHLLSWCGNFVETQIMKLGETSAFHTVTVMSQLTNYTYDHI